MSLFPYQREGVAFLSDIYSRRRAYLADEMGLGKTVQAIMAARAVEPHRTTVVCPASVQENWRREWAAWGGPGDLTVVSYSTLIRRGVPVTELVILDEAHYCKSPGAKRTKAALKLAQGAKWAWLLSGTPVPNDVRELYPVFKYLWPEYGFPTSAFRWMDRYCVWSENEYGYRVWGNKPAVEKELKPALREIMLRRRLRDVAMELPPLRVTVQHLDRDPKLAAKLEELGSKPEDEEHMSTLRRLLGEYKAPKVARILLDELEQDPKLRMVVLYHHRATGKVLSDMLETRVTHTGFDGSSPQEWRQRSIDMFQAGHARVFLAQQGAAGVGITLTRASEIVLVEPSWSPSDNEQAIKRIHRIGQSEPCRARLFAVPDSLDEALMAALTRKTEMVKEVLSE